MRIWELKDSDLNQREIGKLFNVHKNAIQKIYSGVNWKTLNPMAERPISFSNPKG